MMDWMQGWMGTVLIVVGYVVSAVAIETPAGFETPSSASVSALKIVRGKSVSDGYVFINGKFLKPPYRVARHGNVIAINGVQVTDPLVPWVAFTAEGENVPVRSTVSAKPKAKPAEQKAAAPVATSLDDLFGNESTSTSSAKKTEADSDKDASAGTQEASGFVDNARTQALLKRMNAYRTTIDKRLRRGEACFFGKRYALLPVENRLTLELMKSLPEEMRAASDATQLQERLKARGAVYMTQEICEDLIANRLDFSAVAAHRDKLRDDAALRKMLDGVK